MSRIANNGQCLVNCSIERASKDSKADGRTVRHTNILSKYGLRLARRKDHLDPKVSHSGPTQIERLLAITSLLKFSSLGSGLHRWNLAGVIIDLIICIRICPKASFPGMNNAFAAQAKQNFGDAIWSPLDILSTTAATESSSPGTIVDASSSAPGTAQPDQSVSITPGLTQPNVVLLPDHEPLVMESHHLSAAVSSAKVFVSAAVSGEGIQAGTGDIWPRCSPSDHSAAGYQRCWRGVH